MPWTLNDYPNSFKNLDKITRKKAIDIANALVEEGYQEGRAIPIAIEQAKKWYDNSSQKEREEYLGKGKVTEHDHKYPSNPELLDENEMVIKHEEGWAVQSRKAKKAAKVFDQKSEAIKYGEKVARNKQSKLEVYKEDGTIQTIDDFTE